MIRKVFLFSISLFQLGIALGQGEIMNLSVGDPERSDREVSVSVDALVDTSSGSTLSPQALAEHLVNERLIFVAEQHTSLEYHRVQLRVLELLQEAGQSLMIGLEMLHVENQSLLDAWTAGMFVEADFIEQSDWYGNWGYHWGYYREIFLFARAHGIPMVALDASRDVGSDAGAHGVASPPAPDLSSDDHRTLFGAFFETDDPVHGGLPEDQLEALFAAQCARDAVMAYNAATALNAHPDTTMVVLAGTGHIVYELGIARQIASWYEGPATTIVPVSVESEDTLVQASVGDFVWGVPDMMHPAFPELGTVVMRTDAGLAVFHVEPDSPAGRGGIEAGDVLTHFKNVAIAGKAQLNQALATVEWGDEVALGILRDGEQRELALTFQR